MHPLDLRIVSSAWNPACCLLTSLHLIADFTTEETLTHAQYRQKHSPLRVRLSCSPQLRAGMLCPGWGLWCQNCPLHSFLLFVLGLLSAWLLSAWLCLQLNLDFFSDSHNKSLGTVRALRTTQLSSYQGADGVRERNKCPRARSFCWHLPLFSFLIFNVSNDCASFPSLCFLSFTILFSLWSHEWRLSTST